MGAVRPESIERDDAELTARSVQVANNCMILSTGAMQSRPGSYHVASITGTNAIEIEPENGVKYFLEVVPSGIVIRSQDGASVVSFSGATWTDPDTVWLNNLGDTVLMGSQSSKIHALLYDSGVFTFGVMAFASGAGGSSRQPYWPYRRDVTIRPSGLSGSITVTASGSLFTANYVGERIRYVDREIEITSVTSPTVANGTVIDDLPPTKTLGVSSTSGFRVGDAVEHSVLGGQGIITSIGASINVLVTKFFTGFDASGSGNDLIGPNAKSQITSFSTGTPAATTLWDEPLMSAERGYAGSSSEHKGRVVLHDFPEAKNVIAISAADTYDDFTVGTNDDDAIIDSVGAKSTRILHSISAEDLIILTSSGAYYQETRERAIFSPSTWSPVKFDRIGSSTVRPARVSDGVVFVSSNGKNIMGATLQGDVYKSWSVTPLSEFHSHLIKAPVSLGSIDGDTDTPERFVFVANSDGTAAVMRWERGIVADTQTVGWVPWSTTGSYLRFFVAFGSLHAIVSRSSGTILERMDNTAVLDNAAGAPIDNISCLKDENDNILVDENGNCLGTEGFGATHLAGATATVYLDKWDLGEYPINASGFPVDEFGDQLILPASSIPAQIGLNFESKIVPWAKRSVDSAHGKQEARRIVRLAVSVQDTVRFKCRNELWGNYDFNADLENPPALRTETAYFSVPERSAYPEIPIVKDRPGPFRLTALRYKVQV